MTSADGNRDMITVERPLQKYCGIKMQNQLFGLETSTIEHIFLNACAFKVTSEHMTALIRGQKGKHKYSHNFEKLILKATSF